MSSTETRPPTEAAPSGPVVDHSRRAARLKLRRDTRRSAAAAQPRAGFRLFHLNYYVLLVLITSFSVAAFGWIFNQSLKTNQEFIGTRPFTLASDPQWGNYRLAWVNAEISTYFANSVVVTLVATVIGVAVSALAAYPLSRVEFRLRQPIILLFLVGLMIPWMVSFIPLYNVLQTIGLLDTRTGIVLVYATYNIPFNLFILIGFMRTLPRELEEAAIIDGASTTRTFLSIILPLSRSGIASVAIINILNNWNEFFYAYLFLISNNRLTIPVGLFRLGQAADYGTNWVTLFAGILITVIPVLVAFAFLQRQIAAGLTAGALKG
jgi:ABC-type glycerol-3-phosphate transport system permease component